MSSNVRKSHQNGVNKTPLSNQHRSSSRNITKKNYKEATSDSETGAVSPMADMSAPTTSPNSTSSHDSPNTSVTHDPANTGVVLQELRTLTELQKKSDLKLEGMEAKFEAKFEELKSHNQETTEALRKYFGDHINSLIEDFNATKKILNDQIVKLETDNSKLMKEVSKIRGYEMDRLSKNLIVSGMAVKPFEESEDSRVVAKQAIEKTLNITLPTTYIDSAERLGKPPQTPGVRDTRKIVLRLNSRNMKQLIMDSNINNMMNRPRDLYIGEELTKDIDELCFRLRTLKKQNPNALYTTYTKSGRIYIKKTREGRPSVFETECDLVSFLDKLGLTLPPLPDPKQRRQTAGSATIE